MLSKIPFAFCGTIAMLALLGLFAATPAAAAVWYVATGSNASDANPGTADRPVSTVAKAVSLAKPGDTVAFSAGTYPCSEVKLPDGSPDLPIVLRREGKGKVILTNDGSANILLAGSYNTINGIEFQMISDHPRGSGIRIDRKEHVAIRNCRFFACQTAISTRSAHYLSITNCETAYSGARGINIVGGGDGEKGHLNRDDENRYVEVRNCYLHDAGWNTRGTEGYGINIYGASEFVAIENNQIDNNTGDGILYEDWTVHSTARYNVIRGTGIAAIWIDNASMSVFESNYLEANNVAVWLSGEESSNRYLGDMIAIRNNIVVHNDWSAFHANVYGKAIFFITSNTRDAYFENNTVAFNNADRVVGMREKWSSPARDEFRNICFRNNIFWQNTGGVGGDPGIDLTALRFTNNLWDKPYQGDEQAKTGDPLFVDAKAHTPEGYRIQGESAARGQGLLLYENPLDFWNGARPHLSKTGKYDLGAHQFGTTGTARIGLDRTTFPFDVPSYELRFNARPPR